MKILTRDLLGPSGGERTQATRFDVYDGFGSPEGVVTAKMGDYYINRNGGTSQTFWVKETGFNTSTGWVSSGAAAGGWIDEEIFTASEGQVDFTVTGFSFDANSQLEVLINGIDQDEGGGLDWIRNVGLSKITLNKAISASARVKIKKWK